MVGPRKRTLPSREKNPGGKVRAVWAVQRVPGSFAALRMTAKTNNGKTNNGKDEQRQGQITGKDKQLPDDRVAALGWRVRDL